MSDPLSRAQAEIRAVLARSSMLEDARHAEDTLAWLLRLKPDPGPALALAALGHDIDRVAERAPLRREAFETLAAFENAHAHRGACALRKLLDACGVASGVTARACWLVEHHECGGDPAADLLRDADRLSWFRMGLPAVYRDEGRTEAKQRCARAYACLSLAARRHFPGIHHDDPLLDCLLREVAPVPRSRPPSRWMRHG